MNGSIKKTNRCHIVDHAKKKHLWFIKTDIYQSPLQDPAITSTKHMRQSTDKKKNKKKHSSRQSLPLVHKKVIVLC